MCFHFSSRIEACRAMTITLNEVRHFGNLQFMMQRSEKVVQSCVLRSFSRCQSIINIRYLQLFLLFSDSIDDSQRDLNFSWLTSAFVFLLMSFIEKSRCRCEQKWHETIKKCDSTVENAIIIIYAEVASDIIIVNRIKIVDDVEVVNHLKLLMTQ